MATPTVTKKTSKASRKAKGTKTDAKSKAANDKADDKAEIVWVIKTATQIREALDTRDEERRKEYDAKLKARRDEVAAMDDFIRSVLQRADVKVMTRPRQAVIDALIKEKKQTTGQAKGAWNEFRLVCLSGMYDE